MSPAEVSKYVDGLVAKRQYLQTRHKELTTNKNDLREQVIALQDALVYIQNKARDTQDAVRFHIEDVVNSALDAVFPGEYSFNMEFVVKRNKTECNLILMEGTNQIDDPLNSVGGGVADILALALRMVLLLISKGDKVLVLDEPLKCVDQGRKPLAYEMLQRLCHDTGIQLICVSHDPLMIDIADSLFNVTKKDGISSISLV